MSFYPNLFAPFESKRLKSKNRIVMLPHGTGMTRNGEPTEEDLGVPASLGESREPVPEKISRS